MGDRKEVSTCREPINCASQAIGMAEPWSYLRIVLIWLRKHGRSHRICHRVELGPPMAPPAMGNTGLWRAMKALVKLGTMCICSMVKSGSPAIPCKLDFTGPAWPSIVLPRNFATKSTFPVERPAKVAVSKCSPWKYTFPTAPLEHLENSMDVPVIRGGNVGWIRIDGASGFPTVNHVFNWEFRRW
jgi:hypothetical protein